ncbi:imidazole glycerol phosphate synthase subunit HisH [Ginsengibacter hankyongi]|uniref:Imidazole glycerol phosphate synthase subunit HisH n=1 Tax=Ginsengibacter hankyongi TaxID=2607284 RepID=A0A5J5ILU1_9BACT|nr:imidazole glycerol phosphate synthase subunit HisH [Ginsengibacter hankyongi]KAA9041468.1 imidazole glycerol phosphate synthase subunit HisH [Ginsengibacter hankyongi]
MIAIIDYGVGNVGSILNMMNYIGIPAIVTKDYSEIRDASKLILPGVGSFDQAITLFNKSGLKELIDEKVNNEATPILGICLGMQMMTQGSAEGELPGLGWFEAKCIKFKFDGTLHGRQKIPHMGWNDITPVNSGTSLFKMIDQELKYYFAHSYHITGAEKYSIATASYGYDFTVAIKNGNKLGVQFHPERSHMFGVNLFKSFSEI